MKEIHAVQVWRNDVWRTIHLSTYPPDALESFEVTTQVTDTPVRLVAFSVDSFDFIAVEARDFQVVTRRT